MAHKSKQTLGLGWGCWPSCCAPCTERRAYPLPCPSHAHSPPPVLTSPSPSLGSPRTVAEQNAPCLDNASPSPCRHQHLDKVSARMRAWRGVGLGIPRARGGGEDEMWWAAVLPARLQVPNCPFIPVLPERENFISLVVSGERE